MNPVEQSEVAGGVPPGARRLLHAGLLFRHGARGPGKAELGMFKQSPAAQRIWSQWRPEELEQVTPVGVAMMEATGEWFRAVYLERFQQAPGAPPLPVAWRSSIVPRVVESGRGFVRGMNHAEHKQSHGPHRVKVAIPKEPLEYGEGHPRGFQAEDVFRAWNRTWFRDKVKTMAAEDDEWVSHAEAMAPHLRRVHDALGAPTDGVALTRQLLNMTYVVCLIDAETHWTTHLDALQTTLQPDEVHVCEELARWVWERRFLNNGWGLWAGGNLLLEMVDAMVQSPSPSAAIYAAHDYTILALLSALTVQTYDEPVLGYGASMLLELWEMDDGARRVRVLLNPRPFAGSAPGARQEVRDEHRVVLEVALNDLEAYCAAVPAAQAAIEQDASMPFLGPLPQLRNAHRPNAPRAQPQAGADAAFGCCFGNCWGWSL